MEELQWYWIMKDNKSKRWFFDNQDVWYKVRMESETGRFLLMKGKRLLATNTVNKIEFDKMGEQERLDVAWELAVKHNVHEFVLDAA